VDNEHRGEVSIVIDGKPRTVIFDWDAIARLKNALGTDFDGKIAQAGSELDMETLAVALSVGLQRGWPKVSPTVVQAQSPPVVEVIRVLGDALNLAFYGNTEAPPATVNPPNRQSRRASSSRRAKKPRSVPV
jgi:hypothetical protein